MPTQPVAAPTTIIDQLYSWFKITQPTQSHHDTHLLFSKLVEEHIDLLVAFQEAGLTAHARDEIGFSVSVLDFLKRRLAVSSQGVEIDIPSLDRAAVLRALCEQLVTIVSIAASLEMNIGGAMNELVASQPTPLDPPPRPVFNFHRKPVPVAGHTAPHYPSYI